MKFWPLLLQVMPQLDHQIITSKAVLDETIAGWLLPLLPKAKANHLATAFNIRQSR